MKNYYLYLKCLLILILVLTYGCNKKTTEPDDNNQEINVSRLNSDSVKTTPVINELIINGKVSFNEDTMVRIFPMVSGIVTKVNTGLGDYATKGQVIAELRSSDIAGYGNQLIVAESNLNIAKKNFESSSDMFKSGLVSEKDFITSKNELLKANSELDRAREVINIVGTDKNSVNQIKAPVSGYIVEKNINAGMQIRNDASNNVFTIADLSTVWIIANVYEHDINKISLGMDAEVTTMAFPDKVYTGKIDKILNVLDPATRTMKIRIKLSNKNLELKPEMYCKVSVKFNENKSLPAVSNSALVFDNSKYFVLILNNQKKIEIREVIPYKIINDFAYLSSGVTYGEKYVSKDALFVYNALKS